MPKSTKEEKYRWIKPIIDGEISIKNMVKVCLFSERSLKYWLAHYREFGMNGLENKSQRPKSNPKETPIRIKERIIELRKETNKCSLKLKWNLEKEGIIIHKNTIQKIIKKERLVRKYRIRKLRYKYIKVPLTKGELVEIDVKYVPDLVGNKRYYQFTAIDCASRWRYLKVYDNCSNFDSMNFLKELIEVAPFRVRAIKTDNGSNFTNRYTGYLKSSDPFNPGLHDLDLLCQKYNITHYLIDPGKPAQNGRVERSHREDQEKFYERNKFKSLKELEKKIRIWNDYYNNLEHCGLNGLSPNKFLRLSEVQNVCG
ncbi:MAG: Transposase [Candidatus Jorgensenbacteria bacterium GW2011_GWA2_45_9]|uniref:Transposase n=2 Tax=Candidatus Joergenseniibacteriota TaxID=1752739 RepID=A0A0G1N5X9_9BACT|nr:MAG: Transposase [Candidatus Jorgensenbacteria bacterium GW2011_GWA2_45_9]